MATKIIYLSHDEMNKLGYKGLDQVKDRFILMRKDMFKDWQNANKDQGFIEMTHEKKKMTRKEAIECILKHIPAAHNAAGVIDFYIEAGMLEIVEELPPRDKFIKALAGEDIPNVYLTKAIIAYDKIYT